MGELLKGIKRNLLHNKKNSFNIGFSNRSPFSYQLPSADPNSGVTQVNPPDMNDGTVERIQAQADATSSMIDSFSNLASTAIKEEKKKYSDQDIAKQKQERIQNRADRKNEKMVNKEARMAKREGGGTDKQKERVKKIKARSVELYDKAKDIGTDIEDGEYSDVSGRDLERIAEQKAAAEGKAATQLAEWQSEEANKETVLANANKKKTQLT